LIEIARTSLAQARRVYPILEQAIGEHARHLFQHLGEWMLLVEHAIDQVERRNLQDQTLAADDKIVSLFEPHTQIIRRGKAPPHETEFGHKVNFAEVEHGLISDWQVVRLGNPPDEQMLPPLLRQHRHRFGQVPKVLAGDRGVFSPANEQLARRMGVKEIVLPQRGHCTAQRKAHEKQTWFKKGQRFRNGIEGRISVVKRTVQLRRCPYHGSDGFERWVGWGILVANLVVIARTLHKRRHRKRHVQN
jgi:IS5 family transposase